METLAELLAQYAAGINELDDAALAQLLEDIRAASEDVINGEPNDDQLALLGQAAEAVEAIETAQAARVAAAEARAAEAQALRDRIMGQGDEAEGDEPADEVDGEGDDEEAPAEVDGEAPAADGDSAPAATDAGPVPVAASAASAAPATRVTRAVARRPAAMTPSRRTPTQAQVEDAPLQLVAAANLPDIPAGMPLDTPMALARAMMSAYNATRGYRGGRTKIPVARLGGDASDMFPTSRMLGRDTQLNNERIEAVVSTEAIAAAGGICAPPQINYEMPTIGSDARPVRDTAMARFGADRGGVTTFPPPIIDDVEGAIEIWTEANDRNPTSPATKPCLTVDCPDSDTTIVEAITKCFEFGNFRARFWPEQIAAWVRLGSVQHARVAETELLTSIGTGSTQVTSGQGLGAALDVLTTLDRAIAQIASRFRDDSIRFRFVAPFYLAEMIRADIVRQMPGTGTYDEKMAIADAQIQRWIEARGVNVTWTLDGEAGQVFGAQGDGPLQGWPSTIVTYLYPEGAWLHLDGGELDLGLVRDTTTNSTNDYQIFYESFEGAHFHDVVSYRLTMDLCPDGSTSAAVAFDPCGFGS